MPEMSNNEPGAKNREADKCPYIERTLDDCYMNNLTSLTIPAAVKYCLGDFTECPILSAQRQFQRT